MNSKVLESFRILKLEPDASFDEVKKAWRQLAKVWHPDLFPNNSELQHKAQERLKAVNNAYEILEEYFASGEAQQFRDSAEQSADENDTKAKDDSPQDDSRSRPQSKTFRQIIILLLSVVVLSMLAVIVILVKKQASPNQLAAKVPVENKFSPRETSVKKVFMPPVITRQPINQSVLAGANVTFNVAVSGSGPFSYQWKLNGTNLPNGIVSTVAGDGKFRYSGDGGAATLASFRDLNGLTVDAAGNLFIVDDSRIRKISTDGIITTVAGNGMAAYSGDDGAATNACLNKPYGVAVDSSGDLFISDFYNNCVRKVFTNGVITTLTGGKPHRFIEVGAATNAGPICPFDLAVDASGNLFIADAFSIRKVSTNGIIRTVAGNNRSPGYSGDGGAATNARLNWPRGVALDRDGNLFISESKNQCVRKISTNGIITTVAGNGTAGCSGDGGAATNASLNRPNGVAVDGDGNLFIADEFNHRIRKVSNKGIITTVVGGGEHDYIFDVGPATDVELNYPRGVALDSKDNLFITDTRNSCLRKVSFSDQPNLNLSSVSAGMVGDYSVIITGAGGSITSSVARLTLLQGNAR